MENDKNSELEEGLGAEEEDFVSDTSSRARNRTVMLTPEITGEVRARLAQDIGAQDSGPSGEGSGMSPIKPATGQLLSGVEPPTTRSESSERPSASLLPPSSSGDFQRPMSAGGPSSGSSLGAQSRPASGSFSSPSGDLGARSGGVFSTPGGGSSVQPSRSASVNQNGEGTVWQKMGPIVGFLVSYDADPNGTVFELRAGRLIVTSEAAGSGNYMVVADSTVSPMHAIMRISADGDIQVLDQLSEYGTKIKRAEEDDYEELSGDKSAIGHGDIIHFGERKFSVCMVTREDE